MSDKILESQEYLKKVAEAIKRRQIGTQEAISAAAINNTELNKKFKNTMPFDGNCLMGVEKGIASNKWSKHKFVKPFHFFAKKNDLERYKINDSIGRYYKEDENFLIPDDITELFNKTEFNLLDWVDNDNDDNYTHLTHVDKMVLDPAAYDQVSFVRENIDRIKTWKQIHETIEIIAADKMKDNGITF